MLVEQEKNNNKRILTKSDSVSVEIDEDTDQWDEKESFIVLV